MDPLVVDLLFTTDCTVKEIAIRVGAPVQTVRQRIAALGLGWVRGRAGMSRGHAALLHIMEELVPGEKIITEQPIGERLKLDVYCPKYKLAAEFHGQQHFAYVEHFHGDYQGFRDSQKRDERKIELCREKGVTLVAFHSGHPMTEEFVFKSLMEAMQAAPPVHKLDRVKTEKSVYLQEQAEKNRQYRKREYRRIKQERKL